MKSKRAKKLKTQLDTILATEINSAFQRNHSFSDNNRVNLNMGSSIMEKSDSQERKKKKIVETPEKKIEYKLVARF